MHVAFGRVRRKSLIFAEDADYADFKRFGHRGFGIEGVASFLSESRITQITRRTRKEEGFCSCLYVLLVKSNIGVT